MAISFDGFDVFQRLAKNSDAFPGIGSAVSTAARDIVVKYLKAKTTDLAAVRAMLKCLGAENMGLILDTMKDSEVKAFVSRLDRHNREIKTASSVARRQQLRSLSNGSADPVQKAAPKQRQPARPRSTKRPSVGEGGSLFGSEAMAAVRDQKRR